MKYILECETKSIYQEGVANTVTITLETSGQSFGPGEKYCIKTSTEKFGVWDKLNSSLWHGKGRGRRSFDVLKATPVRA